MQPEDDGLARTFAHERTVFLLSGTMVGVCIMARGRRSRLLMVGDVATLLGLFGIVVVCFTIVFTIG
jgi:hypothetical protein